MLFSARNVDISSQFLSVAPGSRNVARPFFDTRETTARTSPRPTYKGAQICTPFQPFPTAGASRVQKGMIFGTLREAAIDRTAEIGIGIGIGIGEVMLSFALAQELKNAGFVPKTNCNAVYFINDHLKIRREDALRMWYGDKARVGMDLDLSKEVVYSPTLTELIGACGEPFSLSC
jgi:hypothetical protein